MVQMLKPITLTEAFEAASWQEQSLELQLKQLKLERKVPIESKFGMYKSQTSSTLGSSLYKVPPRNNGKAGSMNTPRNCRLTRFNSKKAMVSASNVEINTL